MVTELSTLRLKTAERLAEVSGDSAAFDADLLIERALGIPLKRLDLIPDEKVDPTNLEPLITRRLGGEPTQYILGEWEFFGLPFYVGEGVLIPRPDTEVLVERALDSIKHIPSPRVLDLCAGSGCISVALKHSRPDALVTAVELYDSALGYLKRNIERNGVDIEVRQFDVLKKPSDFGQFDLIISNPPYIDRAAMSTLDESVKREPHTALFGGEDGLEFYRAIGERWCSLLSKGGCVAVEIGFDQAQSVTSIFRSRGMEVTLHRDYGGNDRVIIGTQPII